MTRAKKKAEAPIEVEQDNDAGALIVLETIKPKEVFVPGGVDALIAVVQAEVDKFVPDITTEEGRKKIGKFNREIASSKNGIDKMRLEFTKGLRDQIEEINAEGKRFTARMEEFQEQVTAPLEKWKADENARLDAHKERLERIKALGAPVGEMASVDLADRKVEVEALLEYGTYSADPNTPPYDWQEFRELAETASEEAINNLSSLHEQAVKREAQAAELAELRAEKARRDKEAEDNRLREEGERKAQKAADDAKAEAERVRVSAHQNRIQQMSGLVDNLATTSAAVIEDRIRQVGTLHDGHDWQEFSQHAKEVATSVRQTLDAILPATRKREEEAQAQKDKEIADRAAKAEKDRQAAAQKAADDATAAREADKQHRAAINNAAVDALVQHAGITREQSIEVVRAIASKNVPNVNITY